MYPPISANEANELLCNAIDYALSKGIIVRTTSTSKSSHNHDEKSIIITHAPFTLFPTPFPATLYEHVIQLQPIFNKLVDACSRDNDFISEAMESLSKVDEFMEKLYEIYKKVYSKGATPQKITLALHRSDYMLHNSSPPDQPESLSIKQVEFNTIAASFSSLSNRVSDLHQYLAQTQREFNLPSSSTMPLNSSIKTIPKGLAKAWQLYNKQQAIVVMVVQSGELNAFDQRWIEYTLFDEYKIVLVRKSLVEIYEQGQLDSDGELTINGREVAVTYFRAGYTPKDYPTTSEWQARLMIEQSKTIKCPNIAYHLVGSKKVQQIFDLPGMVERFIQDPEEVTKLRSCFMRMYPLDGSDIGMKARQIALQNPENYVMKPQREGGGNNIYGNDIKATLQNLSPSDGGAYILMELIRAPHYTNMMVRLGKLITGDVVSELGIYGVWISEGDVVHMNESGGHLLRTKASTSNEGGVAAGFAVLDSPLLV